MSWTQTTTDELVTLWRGGYSASEIAGRLGPAFTRNAVLGKIHRLGIAERWKTPQQAKRENVANVHEAMRAAREKRKPSKPVVAAKAVAPIAASFVGTAGRLPSRRLQPEEILAATGEALETAVGLLDLRPGQCRWAYGERDFVFCGAPVVTRVVNKLPCPWCETHARLAYAPRPQPEKRVRPAARELSARAREFAL